MRMPDGVGDLLVMSHRLEHGGSTGLIPPAARWPGRGRLRRRAPGLAAAAVALAPALARAAGEQASDGTAFAGFGYTLSQAGSTGLVGAYGTTVGGNTFQGAAYVFRNLDTAAGTVTENAKLTASDGAASAQFGIAVSVSGSTGLVGAADATVGGDAYQGTAYVFRNLDTAAGTVTQNAKLTASDGAATAQFGAAVSLSGSAGLVGARNATVGGNGGQGAAYVFRNLDTAAGTVTENAKLTASDGAATAQFGAAVSLSGSAGLVGADNAMVGGNSFQGAAYVFRNLGTATGTVTQNAKLTASDGAAYADFGAAVSLSGSTGLVGAGNATVGSNGYQGAAYVFRNLDTAAGTVTQNAKLTASDGAAYADFGVAVSLSGSTGLVGANGATVGGTGGQGAAYLFRNLDTAVGTVTQNVKLTASDGTNNANFGRAVSLNGDAFNIGAYEAAGVAANTGKAYYGTVSSVTTLDAGNATRIISGISFVSQDDWVIGQTTSSNQVTISKSDTANVTATGRGVYVGQTAGSNGNTLLVNGTVVANAVTIGAASGTTGNKLQIANDGGTTSAGTVNASSGITVNPGGTLILSGLSTVSGRIGNATPLTLAGGTFNLAALSEGAAATTGLGTLSVTAKSTLDFGAGSSGNVIQFAGVGTHAVGQQLQVTDWENTPGAAGGPDRLLFAGLVSAFTLAYPQSDVSFDGTAGYSTTQYSGYFEVDGLIATPEPTSLLLLGLSAAPLGLGRRRRPRRP